MDYQEKVQIWLEKLPEGDPLRAELESLKGNEKELEERFYQDISFGTAGLRGKVGVGTDRMNVYTVGRAAQGVADYISSLGEKAKRDGVIIIHDCRHFSDEFSRLVASIMVANGIHAFLFDGIRPTPELSFLIPALHAAGGVNITASHNPSAFNGFKAYGSDGCQIGSDVAEPLMKRMSEIDYFSGVRKVDVDEAIRAGKITMLGEKEDRLYLDEVLSLTIHDGDELDLTIPMVYTPLHGAGAIPFQRILRERGFKNVHVVPEQEQPDPDFSTVSYPNPEDPKAFRMAEALGRKVGAEVLMATDPDSDRFAIELRSDDGSYVPLNGNQTGYLLANYILEGRRDAGTLPAKGAIIRSIVTSTMTTRIAASYGIDLFETLTGFKNLCGKIPDLLAKGYEVLLAYEESIGYAASPRIWDKDGLSAGMLIVEAAAYYKKQGKTLWQVLEGLYARYGWFAERGTSLVLEGLEGAARIKRMMSWLRENPPVEVAGLRVENIVDYQDGAGDIPPSNVLRIFLENGSWFAVRPSGTEPKIKFYVYTVGKDRADSLEMNQAVSRDILARLELVP